MALSQTYVANYLCCLFQSINANCAVTIRLANKTRAWTIDLFSVQILEIKLAENNHNLNYAS